MIGASLKLEFIVDLLAHVRKSAPLCLMWDSWLCPNLKYAVILT